MKMCLCVIFYDSSISRLFTALKCKSVSKYEKKVLFFLIFNDTNGQLFATMKHLKNLHNITKLHEENYKSTILKIAVDFFTANSKNPYNE